LLNLINIKRYLNKSLAIVGVVLLLLVMLNGCKGNGKVDISEQSGIESSGTSDFESNPGLDADKSQNQSQESDLNSESEGGQVSQPSESPSQSSKSPDPSPTGPSTPEASPIPTEAVVNTDLIADVGNPNFVPGSLYKGPVIEWREPGESVSLGAWWWVLRGLVAPYNGMSVDMILDMLIANNINEIYLDVSKMIPLDEEISQGGLSQDDIDAGLVSERYVRGFIKKCSKYGIRVEALTGAASDGVLRWIDPQYKYYQIKGFVEKIADFNYDSAADEKFYGIHLDVEPHTMKDWEKQRAKYSQWMADFTVKAREESDKYGLKLAYDVYAWFTEKDMVTGPNGQTMNIIDLMTSQCHALGVMSYYNTAVGQYDRATNTELAYAIKNNCKLIAGTETIKISPSTISYYSVMPSGKNKLIREQKALRGMFDESGYSNFGGAIHHVYSLYELLTKE